MKIISKNLGLVTKKFNEYFLVALKNPENLGLELRQYMRLIIAIKQTKIDIGSCKGIIPSSFLILQAYLLQ